MQGEEAARRLTALGVDPAKIVITGSLKFDALQSAPIPKRGPERVLRFFRVGAQSPGADGRQHAARAKKSR